MPTASQIPSDLRVGRTEDISSNTVLISVPATSNLKESEVAAVAANPPVTDKAKLQKLDDAVYYGYYYMANPAWVHYRDGLPPNGDSNAKSIHSAQHDKWFGKYNNNDHYDRLVAGMLDALLSRMNQGLRATAVHKFKWVESCPAGPPSTTAAIAHIGSVDTAGVYEVVLCDFFWALAPKPVKGSPADSQAATIVHEASHFADRSTDVVGWTNKTEDRKYGRAACQQLAVDSRAKSASNASNFEYFIVDVMEYFWTVHSV